MQQAKRPRIESRNPNTYFLGIGRFAPKAANGARSLGPSACVYRKPKPVHNGNEGRQGSGMNL
jgi:hypothetical protein